MSAQNVVTVGNPNTLQQQATITTATSSAGTGAINAPFISSTGTSASSIGLGMRMREPTSEVSVAGIKFPHYEPMPNAFVRFWQKRLLGIEWKDLRPEQKMKALGDLK